MEICAFAARNERHIYDLYVEGARGIHDVHKVQHMIFPRCVQLTCNSARSQTAEEVQTSENHNRRKVRRGKSPEEADAVHEECTFRRVLVGTFQGSPTRCLTLIETSSSSARLSAINELGLRSRLEE